MNLLVGVCVYNRLHNIERWLRAWDKSNKHDAKLIVVHNYDGPAPPPEMKQAILEGGPDFYIQRPNIGADVGATQDVVKGLHPTGYTDWDVLAWFVDDFLPMQKDFLAPFLHRIVQPSVGLVGACYEPQNDSNKHGHFRTVGYAIRREVAKKLIWPANPITTRQQCYEMEHGRDNMTVQVERLGYAALPAIGNEFPLPGYSHWPNNDFMWDCSLLAHLKRDSEFEEEFK
jgi:hypothetical protein